MDCRRLLSLIGASCFVGLTAVPATSWAAACHDEVDRLAGRHDIAPEPPPAEIVAHADAAPPRTRAQIHLHAARKADDDGIVEECLRQLAQARALMETDETSDRPGSSR
jgi:hypothetical protein